MPSPPRPCGRPMPPPSRPARQRRWADPSLGRQPLLDAPSQHRGAADRTPVAPSSPPCTGRVHAPLPASFGDEGAANHAPVRHPRRAGLEIFVHGAGPVGGFPARQSATASQALVRRHALSMPCSPARATRPSLPGVPQ
jgi:hypothetical protein